MYCSSCGVAVAQGLSYCNHCGARLNDRDTKSQELKSGMLVPAMVFVFVFGLGAIAFLMVVMNAVNFNVGQIFAFTLFSFLLLLLLEGVFISLLLRRQRGPEEAAKSLLSNKRETKELDAARPRVLPEPTPSVTEHTTRAFDPLYSERMSK